MLFEVFAFFGIMATALALLAELGAKPFLGIAAGVILIVLAWGVLLDDLQLRAGESTITQEWQQTLGSTAAEHASFYTDSNSTTYSDKNITLNATTINLEKNATTTYTYAPLPQFTPVMETKVLLWLILLFCGVYGVLSYAEDIRAMTRK